MRTLYMYSPRRTVDQCANMLGQFEVMMHVVLAVLKGLREDKSIMGYCETQERKMQGP